MTIGVDPKAAYFQRGRCISRKLVQWPTEECLPFGFRPHRLVITHGSGFGINVKYSASRLIYMAEACYVSNGYIVRPVSSPGAAIWRVAPESRTLP